MNRHWPLAAALLVLAPLAGHAESDPFWDGALIRERDASAPPARQNPSRQKQSGSDLSPARAEHRGRMRAVPAPAADTVRGIASRRSAPEIRWDLAAALPRVDAQLLKRKLSRDA
ncbi:MAG: hypothetical protein CO113_04885 [Elusimicrobia bacterium CG_4_9_14_3_um_filter_62_55]|nr:MAG: hypothetical protein COR54_01180 [Elusimicrobia bacterium CG22_combo_CG10-13_8_21_14_all_63_91]PJB26154.1 MAG: hypothetical protein CO113_04885 [Elusimicrobia bacterium CG_4_9_14_3_um_filter_62_55]